MHVNCVVFAINLQLPIFQIANLAKLCLGSSVGLIQGEMRLVSAKTGKLLWKQPIKFNEQQQNSSGNPLADIVGAVIVQALSGLTESKFFNLSSAANASAINNPASGLLEGPLLSD